MSLAGSDAARYMYQKENLVESAPPHRRSSLSVSASRRWRHLSHTPSLLPRDVNTIACS